MANLPRLLLLLPQARGGVISADRGSVLECGDKRSAAPLWARREVCNIDGYSDCANLRHSRRTPDAIAQLEPQGAKFILADLRITCVIRGLHL